MKASVQILLTVAVLIPLCSRVFGETMEERKQRIMRKYLSEAQTLEQSDLAPRINELEAALLDDSRKLQQVQSGINSRNTLTAPPSAPMAQPIPAKENRNWLLDEEDPDAFPLGVISSFDIVAEMARPGSIWQS